MRRAADLRVSKSRACDVGISRRAGVGAPCQGMRVTFHAHRPVVRHACLDKGEIDRRGPRCRPPVHLRASAHIGGVISPSWYFAGNRCDTSICAMRASVGPWTGRLPQSHLQGRVSAAALLPALDEARVVHHGRAGRLSGAHSRVRLPWCRRQGGTAGDDQGETQEPHGLHRFLQSSVSGRL